MRAVPPGAAFECRRLLVRPTPQGHVRPAIPAAWAIAADPAVRTEAKDLAPNKLSLLSAAKNLGGMATEARFFAALRMTLCDAAAEIGKLFVAKC